jgi:hypothetical protein
MGLEQIVSAFIGPIVSRLLNRPAPVIIEWDMQPAETANGWPALSLEITVHNRTIVPIYLDKIEVAGTDLLNIWQGTLVKAHRKSDDRQTVALGDKVEAGGAVHLAFALYPNWQAVWSDFSHPHSGDRGHIGGMVMRFQTLLYFHSKADMRLRSPLSRSHEIPAKTVEANASKAHAISGDKALRYWEDEDQSK